MKKFMLRQNRLVMSFAMLLLKEGSIVVIGCSSSEVAGGTIGHNSSLETAQAVFKGIYEVLCERKFTLPHNAVNTSIVQSSLSERLFRTLKS